MGLLLAFAFNVGVILNPCWAKPPTEITGSQEFVAHAEASLALLPLEWKCFVRRHLREIRETKLSIPGGGLMSSWGAVFRIDQAMPMGYSEQEARVWFASALVHEAGHHADDALAHRRQTQARDHELERLAIDRELEVLPLLGAPDWMIEGARSQRECHPYCP